MKHEDAERLAEALNRAEVAEAENERLRAIVNSQKRVGREGPFTAKRSIGRHANALLARAVLAEERLAKVAVLAEEWYGEDAATTHVLSCKDYSCPDCTVIACATDLRTALGSGM